MGPWPKDSLVGLPFTKSLESSRAASSPPLGSPAVVYCPSTPRAFISEAGNDQTPIVQSPRATNVNTWPQREWAFLTSQAAVSMSAKPYPRLRLLSRLCQHPSAFWFSDFLKKHKVFSNQIKICISELNQPPTRRKEYFSPAERNFLIIQTQETESTFFSHSSWFDQAPQILLLRFLNPQRIRSMEELLKRIPLPLEGHVVI